MNTYISLLRGINVSGKNKIMMAELKKLYQSLGFANVSTYIQSGNVVFQSDDNNSPVISQAVENKIKNCFGYDVRVLTLGLDDFNKICSANPFPVENHKALHVMFLFEAPANIPEEEIQKARSGREKTLVTGSAVYIYCPDGYGKSKLSNNFFEKKLKVAGTARNWRTSCKLMEMAEELR